MNQQSITVDENGLTLLRLKQLIDLNYITDFSKVNDVFYISVLTDVLIQTNHLLQHLKTNLSDPITFADDVELDNDIENVTDLIRYFRNTACHINSPDRKTIQWNLDVKSVAFSVIVGKQSLFNYPVRGKYEDDAVLIMGRKCLYIKRHLIRAYEEIMQKYLSRPEFQLYKVVLQHPFNL